MPNANILVAPVASLEKNETVPIARVVTPESKQLPSVYTIELQILLDELKAKRESLFTQDAHSIGPFSEECKKIKAKLHDDLGALSHEIYFLSNLPHNLNRQTRNYYKKMLTVVLNNVNENPTLENINAIKNVAQELSQDMPGPRNSKLKGALLSIASCLMMMAGFACLLLGMIALDNVTAHKSQSYLKAGILLAAAPISIIGSFISGVSSTFFDKKPQAPVAQLDNVVEDLKQLRANH